MVSEMEYQPVMQFINLLILFMKRGITNTTLLAFSDIAKTFYSASHEVLLSKLEHYG